jgi:transient receptor potential cation channel subfamily V protein 5
MGLSVCSKPKSSCKDGLEPLKEEIPEIYHIIGDKGGGELVEIAKRAHFEKNLDNVDEYIVKNLPKYLYNDGKGEMISIEEIIRFRNTNKEKFRKENKNENSKAKEKSKYESYDREVVSKVNYRGRNGETLLHLCFTNISFIHTLLAKKILFYFPKIINDICIGDEYYGQSALHMAISNENPYLVKFLISYGIDLHQRCTGRFFFPDDQKNKIDSNASEFPQVPVKTNYVGFSYFGEYPLAFAAILNQEECVRILIANGADANKQDSNGNTVLHLLVINNNPVNLSLQNDSSFKNHIYN